MGINTESDIEADLQVGPTDAGMVRIYVAGAGLELPMDFTPEEAREIADELRAAADMAESAAAARRGGRAGKSGRAGGGPPRRKPAPR